MVRVRLKAVYSDVRGRLMFITTAGEQGCRLRPQSINALLGCVRKLLQAGIAKVGHDSAEYPCNYLQSPPARLLK